MNFTEIDMHQLALREAETRLTELIGMVADGKEVIITRDDGSDFKIVPFHCGKPTPKFGSARGLVEISDDFDEPIEGFDGFEEYMP